MLLAASFPELRGEAVALSERLNALIGIMRSIRSEGEKLRTETTRLNDARMRLAGLQESKRQSLSERQEELAQVRKAATDISRSVSDLSELISKLDKEVAEKTGLGSYDQEVAAAGPRPGTAPPGEGKAAGPAGPAGAAPRDPSAVLAPGSDRVAMLTPGRIKPAIPFPEAK